MRIFRATFVLLVGLTLSACATAAPGASSRNANVISQQEMADLLGSEDAFQVVERLRPRWLARQSTTLSGSTGTGVVIDGMTRGDLALLRGIRVENIAEMRYLPSRDATSRYGTGYPAGVIEVVTRNAGGL